MADLSRFQRRCHSDSRRPTVQVRDRWVGFDMCPVYAAFVAFGQIVASFDCPNRSSAASVCRYRCDKNCICFQDYQCIRLLSSGQRNIKTCSSVKDIPRASVSDLLALLFWTWGSRARSISKQSFISLRLFRSASLCVTRSSGVRLYGAVEFGESGSSMRSLICLCWREWWCVGSSVRLINGATHLLDLTNLAGLVGALSSPW